MTQRQLIVPVAAFAIQGGVATQNVDIYQAEAWNPLHPTINTGKLRAYFDDDPAGEILAQSVYDLCIERGITVFKNWV